MFLVLQLVDALDYMHSRHFVHLDVKDENILIDPGFNITLIDFGFARRQLRVNEQLQGRRGTDRYVAPEVIENRRYVSVTRALATMLE